MAGSLEGTAAMALAGKIVGLCAVPLDRSVVLSLDRPQSVSSAESHIALPGGAAALSAGRDLPGT